MEVEMKYGTIWNTTLQRYFYSVQQTSDGGYITTGFSEEIFLLGGFEFFFLSKQMEVEMKYGDKTFGGLNATDGGKSVRQTTDGGYIITGKNKLFRTWSGR